MITRQAEQMGLFWQRSPQPKGKRRSTWDIDNWLARLTRTNEQLIGTRTDRVMFFGKEGMVTLSGVAIMRRICEEVESILDYDFTDLNMRLGVMSLTHHMLNVESFCSSAVKAALDSECQFLTETDHLVLLIDKYWLQAAILVMSSSETTVRQLQCERDEETLVTTSFICAGSLIRKGIAHAKSAVTVSTGMKRHGRSFNDNSKMSRERSGRLRATLQIRWSSFLGGACCSSCPFEILFRCGRSAACSCGS